MVRRLARGHSCQIGQYLNPNSLMSASSRDNCAAPMCRLWQQPVGNHLDMHSHLGFSYYWKFTLGQHFPSKAQKPDLIAQPSPSDPSRPHPLSSLWSQASSSNSLQALAPLSVKPAKNRSSSWVSEGLHCVNAQEIHRRSPNSKYSVNQLKCCLCNRLANLLKITAFLVQNV